MAPASVTFRGWRLAFGFLNMSKALQFFTVAIAAMAGCVHSASEPSSPAISANRVLESTAENLPEDVRLRLKETLRRALDFHLRGEWARAASGYEKVLEIHPEAPGVRYQLAVCAYNQKDLAGARRLLADSLARGEEVADCHNLLGNIEAVKGNHAAAAEQFAKAAELFPANAQFHYNLGLALRRLERFDDAIAALERAVLLRPQEPLYLYQLNLTRIAARKDMGLRERIAEQLTMESPTGDWLLLSAAELLEREEDVKKAIERIRQAKGVMTAPIFYGMIQDPIFTSRRKELAEFFEVEVIEIPKVGVLEDPEADKQAGSDPSAAPPPGTKPIAPDIGELPAVQ